MDSRKFRTNVFLGIAMLALIHRSDWYALAVGIWYIFLAVATLAGEKDSGPP